MFENVIQTNGTQSWKWVTIRGRVFVDNADLEADTSGRSADEVFEELARERLSDNVIPYSDEPFKFDAISFDDDEPEYRKPPREKMPF